MLTHLYEPPLELANDQRIKIDTATPLNQTVTRALKGLAKANVEAPCPPA